ncbi:MAG: DUF2239 family protein [Ferrovibrio sp.]
MTCTAFSGANRIARGPLPDVALAVKAALTADPLASLLTFDDATGRVIDFDLRGSDADVLARLATSPAGEDARARSRGRPKLGVVAREITLLPRHWDWLASQPGGASHALRRLVDEARRKDEGGGDQRAAQEAAYAFMSAMAGNLPGFEEATRSLFAADAARFVQYTANWPPDIRDHAQHLAGFAA